MIRNTANQIVIENSAIKLLSETAGIGVVVSGALWVSGRDCGGGVPSVGGRRSLARTWNSRFAHGAAIAMSDGCIRASIAISRQRKNNSKIGSDSKKKNQNKIQKTTFIKILGPREKKIKDRFRFQKMLVPPKINVPPSN